MKLCGPFYCKICDGIVTEKTCNHPKKNIFDTEQSFAVVKDGALIEIFSKEGFLSHSLQKILDYHPVDKFSNKLTKSKLASKAIAFDHLTYLLLTQNRWLSP